MCGFFTILFDLIFTPCEFASVQGMQISRSSGSFGHWPKGILRTYICVIQVRLKGREWWEGHVGKIKVDGNCINKMKVIIVRICPIARALMKKKKISEKENNSLIVRALVGMKELVQKSRKGNLEQVLTCREAK